MKQITSDYKTNVKEFGREIDSKISYTIGGTTTELGKEQLNSVTPHYESSILKSAMKQLDIDSNVDIPLNTTLNYQFGVLVNNEYEYINYGNYVVYSSEKQEDTNSYKIVCYDKMLYSMVDYTKMNIEYPITIRDYIQAICDTIGLNFKNANDEFVNYDKEIQNELYFDAQDKSLGYKFRDVLDELAQVTGSTICINEETDELEIRYINEGVTYEEAEGTTIDLEDSIKHKISNPELKGNTTQQTYSGKNLIPSEISSQTTSGLVVTKYSDGSFLLNGKTTATISRLWLFENKNIPLSAGTYTLSTNSTGTVNDTVYFVLRNTSNVEMPFTVNLKTQKYKTTTLNNSVNILQGYLYIGTGITFTNYRIYPMFTKENSMSSYEPYVGGIPSPNPSYPQPVNNVTGRQEIDVVGKNLFDIERAYNNPTLQNCTLTKENDKLILTPINTSQEFWFGDAQKSDQQPHTSNKNRVIEIKPNTEYTFKCSSMSRNFVTFYDSNFNIINNSYIQMSGNQYTFTTPQNAKYFMYRIGSVASADKLEISNIQLEEGTTATTYEPYIGKQYEINLGKNLFDKNTITWVRNNNDNYTSTGNTNTARIRTQQLIQLTGGETYTISGIPSGISVGTIKFYDSPSSTEVSSRVTNIETFTVPTNATYVIFQMNGSNFTDETNTLMEEASIQVEKGLQPTSYSPYKTPIELCKIGNYQDYIRKSTGKNLYNPSYRNDNNTIDFVRCTGTEENGIYTMTATASDMYFWYVISAGSNYNSTCGPLFEFKEDTYSMTITNSLFNNNYVTFYDDSKTSLGYISKNSNIFTISQSEKTGAKYFSIRIGYGQAISGQTYSTSIQLEEGSVATEYEPYGKVWYIHKEIGKIDSYNGETITTDYKSTTGELSTGATVYYGLATATDTEITDTELINQLEALSNAKTYDGITHITVVGDLPSTLKISYANGYDLDTINEEYFKDINVNFGEKYGPINSIVLSRSAGADNVYLRDEESIAEDGLHELKISDNQIMNFNDRSDYLPDLLKQLGGLEYYLNDYVSTGITYYEMCDRYFAQIGDTKYSCVMFNDEVLVTQGLVENIHTDMPEESETDYSKADKTDRRINQTNLIVNKQTGDIEALTTKTEEIEEDLSENYYTKETTNQLIQNAETGVTNTFSEAGGNNILRNTNFSATEVLEEGQQYEYWYGNVVKATNTNSANGISILLQNGNLYQEQQVANGTYTVSFYYKKLNPLATGKLVVNGIEYALTEDDYTLFQTGLKDEAGAYITQPIIVNDNHLRVQFTSDTNNAFEVYDIMCNFGTVKLAYSQNQNETITNTVNISKGITITASDKDVKFVATPDGIRIKNKDTDEIIPDFTDKGMDTKNAIIEESATIVGIYRQRVGDQVWDSLM